MSSDPDAPKSQVVEAVPVEPGTDAGTAAGEDAPGDRNESITQPAKLLRIASMVRELLD